jgi:hypothetical protein
VSFDDVLDQVRRWLGTKVAVVLWLNEFGPADGWLIDIDGAVERIDDPNPGVDQPVHHVRFESGNGFALERSWFRSAGWKTIGAQRSLDVDFGTFTLSITPSR